MQQVRFVIVTAAPTRLGLLFILVAPAGAGKNALMNRVIARVPGLRQLPTATTREIRDTEKQGREHLFVSEAEFLDMVENGELLEYQKIHGKDRYYGVPRATVENAMQAGEDLIADIDYLGASFIRNEYPDNVLLIFIQPPSVQALVHRMTERGDAKSEIGRRLLRVPAEMAFAPQCDYLIFNDDLDQAAETLYQIVMAAHSHREIMRLRQAGSPPPVPFRTLASAVVVHGNEVVCHEHGRGLPTVAVAPGEPPHLATLRAIRTELDVETSVDNLLHDTSSATDFIAPANIEFVADDDGEQVTMIYVYRLPERVALPGGWAWVAQEQLALPSQVQSLLAAPLR